jgi:hypothetical protein
MGSNITRERGSPTTWPRCVRWTRAEEPILWWLIHIPRPSNGPVYVCTSTTNIICSYTWRISSSFLPGVHDVRACMCACMCVCLFVSIIAATTIIMSMFSWLDQLETYAYPLGSVDGFYIRGTTGCWQIKEPHRDSSAVHGPPSTTSTRPPTNAAWQFAFVILHISPRTCDHVFSAQVTW